MSVRPKCSHTCASLKNPFLKPSANPQARAQKLNRANLHKTKRFKHIAILSVQEHLLSQYLPEMIQKCVPIIVPSMHWTLLPENVRKNTKIVFAGAVSNFQTFLGTFSGQSSIFCHDSVFLSGLSNDCPLQTNQVVEVPVLTYNVLSPELGTPSHLHSTDPKSLDKDTRLAKIKARLEHAIAAKTIIALQEVDLGWAGKFHAFFAERGF